MNVGDTDKYSTKLPNRVYNKLRVHSIAESKRAARLHEKKDQSTATQAVDQKTRLQLFKMLDSGMLEEVNGVISVGMYQSMSIIVSQYQYALVIMSASCLYIVF